MCSVRIDVLIEFYHFVLKEVLLGSARSTSPMEIVGAQHIIHKWNYFQGPGSYLNSGRMTTHRANVVGDDKKILKEM